jgi:hypothetical protein
MRGSQMETISIRELMSRAYQTVMKHRVLWILGLAAALLSAAGSNQLRIREERLRIFDVDVAVTPELLITAGIVGAVVGLTFFVLRAIFDAALIAVGDRSAGDVPPSISLKGAFAEAWRMGVTGMWRIIGLNLIFLAFVLVVAIGLVLVAGLGIVAFAAAGLLGGQFSGAVAEGWPVLPAGAAMGAALVLLLMALPVGIILALVIQIAQRAAVLEGESLVDALGSGWRIVRSNAASLVRLVLGQFLVNIAVGIVVGIILSVVVLPLAVTLLATAGGVESGALFVTLAVLLVVFAWLVSSFAMALPTAWNSLLWTLYYRAVTSSVAREARGRAMGGPVQPIVPGRL